MNPDLGLRYDVKQPILIALVLISLFLIGLAVFWWLPPPAGLDWFGHFLPAGQAFLKGQSPYEIRGFFNPPWVFFVLAPLAALPERMGFAVGFVIALVSVTYVIFRLKASPLQAAAFILSFPVLDVLALGQLDWLVMLGLICPPWLGLFLVLIKPHLGFTIALFWIIQAWKQKGIWGAIRLVLPVSLAFLLSFLIYGFYLNGSGSLLKEVWNFSFFPFGVPIGLALLGWGIYKNKPIPAASASIFMTPYLGSYSLWMSILLLLPKRRLMIVYAVALSSLLLAKGIGLL